MEEFNLQTIKNTYKKARDLNGLKESAFLHKIEIMFIRFQIKWAAKRGKDFASTKIYFIETYKYFKDLGFRIDHGGCYYFINWGDKL